MERPQAALLVRLTPPSPTVSFHSTPPRTEPTENMARTDPQGAQDKDTRTHVSSEVCGALLRATPRWSLADMRLIAQDRQIGDGPLTRIERPG